jgi:hypothetical protein
VTPWEPDAFARWKDEFPLVKTTSDEDLDHVARTHLEILVRQAAGMAGLDKGKKWPVSALIRAGACALPSLSDLTFSPRICYVTSSHHFSHA